MRYDFPFIWFFSFIFFFLLCSVWMKLGCDVFSSLFAWISVQLICKRYILWMYAKWIDMIHKKEKKKKMKKKWKKNANNDNDSWLLRLLHIWKWARKYVAFVRITYNGASHLHFMCTCKMCGLAFEHAYIIYAVFLSVLLSWHFVRLSMCVYAPCAHSFSSSSSSIKWRKAEKKTFMKIKGVQIPMYNFPSMGLNDICFHISCDQSFPNTHTHVQRTRTILLFYVFFFVYRQIIFIHSRDACWHWAYGDRARCVCKWMCIRKRINEPSMKKTNVYVLFFKI